MSPTPTTQPLHPPKPLALLAPLAAETTSAPTTQLLHPPKPLALLAPLAAETTSAPTTQPPHTGNHLRSWRLNLLLCTILLSACTTPTPPLKQPLDPLQPWTPSRKGTHLADIAGGADLPAKKTKPAPSNIAQGPIRATAFIAWRLYSNTLSRAMGDTCRFGPTCSRFALDSMALGPKGLLLTFARIQRNQLDDHFYPHTDDGFLIDRPWDYVFWHSRLGLQAHQYDIPTGQAWTIFLNAASDLPKD